MVQKIETIAFIGGGRLTFLLLQGLKALNNLPENILISDPHPANLDRLRKISDTQIKTFSENKEVLQSQILFLNIHPDAVLAVADEIKNILPRETLVVSCVPTFTLNRLERLLNGHQNLVRMVPNAPSIIGKGYNPLSFHPSVNEEMQKSFLTLAKNWGQCPIVKEENLESYAILSGMGPTYFWFQWLELINLAQQFGLSEAQAKETIAQMVHGAVDTLLNSNLTPQEVLDLVPVHPLKKQEETIRQIYKEHLTKLQEKFKMLRSS